MSILIKGMRMPENCIKCPMQFGGMCYVMPAEVDESRVAPTVEEAWKQGKPDWCPLVEISEPHGDLIDRDALNIGEYEREDDDTGTLEISLGGLLEVYHRVKDAPAIITNIIRGITFRGKMRNIRMWGGTTMN